jgi:hypothetical protein
VAERGKGDSRETDIERRWGDEVPVARRRNAMEEVEK